jgi:ubiquinone/menaquinone biosynthesis C-methylase UbiE
MNKIRKVKSDESDHAYLLDGLSIDTSGHWQDWDWKQAGSWTSYDFARLEEYRDAVIVAYRLYNRIGLEHVKRMLAKAPRTAKLLDAGGGTGRKAIPLAQAGFVDITLLDHAPGWLRLADEKARHVGVREHLTMLEGDIRDMPSCSDNQFDYAFALGGVVSYCGEPAHAITEMARVLKPGGELLADGIHSRFGSIRFAARAGNWEAFKSFTDYPDKRGGHGVLLPEELETVALQTGLTHIRVWSEFLFELDETIRVGPESERWEEAILELEMRHHDDPRFLGGTALMLRATKKR